MSFFKKGDNGIPPDVGQEEKYDAEHSDSGNSNDDALAKIPAPIKQESNDSSDSAGVKLEGGNIEIEKINVKIESVISWINQFYERFSYVSENIGELRAMNLANEKKISESMKDVTRAIDVVKEVKPEELRIDYQKVDMRINSLEEKLAANKQFMDDVMKEVKDIKAKAEIFIGIDGLLKLNDEVKQDLVGIQKINSKVKMHSDKAEDIFIELQNKFSGIEKTADLVNNLDANYSGLKKEVERLQLDRSNMVKQSDFSNFKKVFNSKVSSIEEEISSFDKVRSKELGMEDLVEMAISIGKKNEDEIEDIKAKFGNSDIKKIRNYEAELKRVLDLVGRLTDKVKVLEGNHGNVPAQKKESPIVEYENSLDGA